MRNFAMSLLFAGVAVMLCLAANRASAFKTVSGTTDKAEKFTYSGPDPFLNLERLRTLSIEQKYSSESVSKSRIVARIRSISLIGTLTGKLGKRALILSNGNIYIVKVGDHIGEKATVVGIEDSLIKIKGEYDKGSRKNYVIVSLKLPK